MKCAVGSSAGRPPCRCVVPSSNTPRTLWLQEALGLKCLGDWASALHPAWSCKRPQQWHCRAPLWSNACFDWVTPAATVYTVCWTSSWAHKSAWILGVGGRVCSAQLGISLLESRLGSTPWYVSAVYLASRGSMKLLSLTLLAAVHLHQHQVDKHCRRHFEAAQQECQQLLTYWRVSSAVFFSNCFNHLVGVRNVMMNVLALKLSLHIVFMQFTLVEKAVTEFHIKL